MSNTETIDKSKKKVDSTKIMNTLKLLHDVGKEPIKIYYTKKDGTPRDFKVKDIVEMTKDYIVILTDDLEYKKLLLENISKIERIK